MILFVFTQQTFILKYNIINFTNNFSFSYFFYFLRKESNNGCPSNFFTSSSSSLLSILVSFYTFARDRQCTVSIKLSSSLSQLVIESSLFLCSIQYRNFLNLLLTNIHLGFHFFESLIS
jgi:hypothetical protein